MQRKSAKFAYAYCRRRTSEINVVARIVYRVKGVGVVHHLCRHLTQRSSRRGFRVHANAVFRLLYTVMNTIESWWQSLTNCTKICQNQAVCCA